MAEESLLPSASASALNGPLPTPGPSWGEATEATRLATHPSVPLSHRAQGQVFRLPFLSDGPSLSNSSEPPLDK